MYPEWLGIQRGKKPSFLASAHHAVKKEYLKQTNIVPGEVPWEKKPMVSRII